MKCNRTTNVAAFKLIELIMVIAVITVLALLIFLAIRKPRSRGGYVDSTSHLKQITLSVRLWSDDHSGLPPSMVSTNQGGAMELVELGSVARYFQVMSNELGTVHITRYMLDEERKGATDWATLRDDNISFFIVPEADGKVPELWLAGARHLATNQAPLKPGVLTMPTSSPIGWVDKLDFRQRSLGYADGHVEKPTSDQLRDSAAKALAKYQEATANTFFRLAIP
jgi:competence protein ComGC